MEQKKNFFIFDSDFFCHKKNQNQPVRAPVTIAIKIVEAIAAN